MVGSLIGSFVTSTFTLPLVAFFGNGNDKHGFMMTIAIFGVAAIVLLITAFKNMVSGSQSAKNHCRSSKV